MPQYSKSCLITAICILPLCSGSPIESTFHDIISLRGMWNFWKALTELGWKVILSRVKAVLQNIPFVESMIWLHFGLWTVNMCKWDQALVKPFWRLQEQEKDFKMMTKTTEEVIKCKVTANTMIMIWHTMVFTHTHTHTHLGLALSPCTYICT